MEITTSTKLTGLLGSPVSHSISPKMHNEAFRLLGLDYVYLAFDVGKEDLKVAVDGLKTLGIHGFNLTMPDKTAVVPLVDEMTPASQIAGACNTVANRNGRLIGHTTDGIGYMMSVKDAGYDIIGEKMTLLGAGGAATAICTQAALDGVAAIDIFRRKSKNAFIRTEHFAARAAAYTGCKICVYDLADRTQLKKSLLESKILTNGTNVGMAPDLDATPLPDTSLLYPELIVSDVIYNPRETRFLAEAKAIGCPTFNGMYMLLYQGAAAFEFWTGYKMPAEEIKKKYFQ